MSNRIYKYPLKPTGTQNVNMPDGARILCVQMQDGVGTLWALVDADSNSTTDRIIRIVGTGNTFQDSNLCDYIGTVLDDGMVYHVWERTR